MRRSPSAGLGARTRRCPGRGLPQAWSCARSKEAETAVLRGLWGLSDLARRERLEPAPEELAEEVALVVQEGVEDSPELRRHVVMEMMVRAAAARAPCAAGS